MDKLLNKKSGFTIIELLISLGILLIFLPFAESMLTNSQVLGSFSKHKIQAAYAAQQIIETQRQNIANFFSAPIGPIALNKPYVIGPANVIIDTKGNYNNTNCNNANTYCGTSVVTVTPTVYTNSSGTKTTSTTTDHFVVQIFWQERILNSFVAMTETYAADIANDPMLN